MIRPNFFVVGAPKTGTTALAHFLAEHSDIFVSNPKEPHYFCTDLKERHRYLDTESSYLSTCFAEARETHLAVGEATTAYMYSREAIPNIMKFNPRAKIIVGLRNPLTLCPSLHAQFTYMLMEDQEDFAKAYGLQGKRREGTNIPDTCPEPKWLQYTQACLLGQQLQRLRTLVPNNQLHWFFQEDLRNDSRSVYESALRFLEVPQDNRTFFPTVNNRRTHRSAVLRKLLRYPPTPLLISFRFAQKLVGSPLLKLVQRFESLNSVPVRAQAIPPDLKEMMISDFSSDVQLLGQITGRDLTNWLR